MMEIFTKKIKLKDKGKITLENDQFREYLVSLSGGSIPAIYDYDSHYVINLKLTFEILKSLNDIDFVFQIYADYTGTVTSVEAIKNNDSVVDKETTYRTFTSRYWLVFSY